MIWKPKERELTQEEAVALAKVELTPYWFGSPPLLAAVKTEESVQVVPLDPEFSKKPRILYFIDPTTFSGQTALLFAKEWFQRFNALHLDSLAILIPIYDFLKRPEAIAHVIAQDSFDFPLVLDYQNLFAPAFRVQSLPSAILFHQGAPYFKQEGSGWWNTTEIEIHRFLRMKDPGLSLLPVFHPTAKLPTDRLRLELGTQAVSGETVQVPGPGFSENLGKYRRGKFPPTDLSESVKDFVITGEWLQNEERIVTLDPEAGLRFFVPGSRFSLIAESMSKTHEPATVWVELRTAAIYDSFLGEHLILEESGEAVLRVTHPQLYHVLVNLPEKERWVILRFPDAKRVPIAIYGIRSGD